MNKLFAHLSYELGLLFSDLSSFFHYTAYFALVVIVFPFTLGLESEFLQRVAPSVFIAGLLLVQVIASQYTFEQDYKDGTLDFFYSSSRSFSSYIGAKFLSQLLVVMAPLLLVLPLMFILYGIPVSQLYYFVLAGVVASPLLLAVVLMSSAILLGARMSIFLSSIISIPLTLPVFIFVNSIIHDGDIAKALQGVFFAALIIFPLSFFVGGYSMRAAVEDA